ncbi:hypothetical protein HU200_066803 [Digitaria exilis]|uniref:Protein EARLY HEADING DATE 2 n=1 Tax=Digitaria exilis TaxID=1010633 RepID=A0A835A785_9POAL|nr:hypothetical protein HU200_066803 [Digitaria exilis]
MQQQQTEAAEGKQQQQQSKKKKRSLPGTPDPEAEVIALSPRALLATNRFVCEICGKGFQRDQNLQLHRRGHNLPWKLRQRSSGKDKKKRVYVCPEASCVHHHPSRALGDLTGIKKHFCRKHGDKKWKCDKCSKKYAVQSDWKAHSKTCGTREYRCDCGTLFSRRDSFITHRAFCDALAEETARLNASTTSSLLFAGPNNNNTMMTIASAPLLVPPQQQQQQQHQHQQLYPPLFFSGAGSANAVMAMPHAQLGMGWLSSSNAGELTPDQAAGSVASSLFTSGGKQMQQHAMAKPPDMSATALLHKAAQMGAVTSNAAQTHLTAAAYDDVLSAVRHHAAGREEETRDFLGVAVQPLGSMPLHGYGGFN